MNTPLLDKLRAHLASISKEQFQQEWADIKALGLEGPSMEEFVHSISLTVSVAEIGLIESIDGNVNEQQVIVGKGENNYSLAA